MIRRGRHGGAFPVTVRSSSPTVWAALAACAVICAAPRQGLAQPVDFTGYVLGLGTYVGESSVAVSGASAFQRLRGMATWRRDRFHVDAAYEHTLNLRESGVQGAQLFTAGGASSNGDWLDLGGTIEERESVVWRHRVDRLAMSIELTDNAELIVGRQPISWATTLVFTPADPFSPFDPSDPFREYRQGVDAARLRVYPGAVSEIDFVVRRSDFGFQETTTAAVRGSTSVGGWDVAAWAGLVHDEGAGALAVSGSVGSWAIRAEGSLRESEEADATVRATLGVDRRFTLDGRDLYLVMEISHDGFGLDDVSDLAQLAGSDALRRGELQSLGSDQAVLQASYQLHPLAGVSGLVLVNLHDGSALLAPGASYSASPNTSIQGGAYLSVGDGDVDAFGVPGSEYGGVPGVVYVSVSWFL